MIDRIKLKIFLVKDSSCHFLFHRILLWMITNIIIRINNIYIYDFQVFQVHVSLYFFILGYLRISIYKVCDILNVFFLCFFKLSVQKYRDILIQLDFLRILILYEGLQNKSLVSCRSGNRTTEQNRHGHTNNIFLRRSYVRCNP